MVNELIHIFRTYFLTFRFIKKNEYSFFFLYLFFVVFIFILMLGGLGTVEYFKFDQNLNIDIDFFFIFCTNCLYHGIVWLYINVHFFGAINFKV